MPYISETVHPSIRGSLVILTSLFAATGKFLVWVIGYACNWRWTALFLLIPTIIMTILMIFLPETPYWLIENNDYRQIFPRDAFSCRRCLSRLRHF